MSADTRAQVEATIWNLYRIPERTVLDVPKRYWWQPYLEMGLLDARAVERALRER